MVSTTLTTRKQQFHDLPDFQKVTGFVIPKVKSTKPLPWRLTDQILGQSRGLPAVRGWLSATNGIEAALWDEHQQTVYMIMLANFQPDAEVREITCTDGTKFTVDKTKKTTLNISAIINDLIA